MAVRKTTTRKTIKSKPTNSFFKSPLFYKLLIFGFFTVLILSQKERLSYYLGFKSRKIFKNETRIVSIERVLDSHSEKSFGIDISEYQDQINWDIFSDLDGGYPIEFIFIRATAGKNRIDCKFKKYWAKARQSNMYQGAYHYYRPNENSKEQAEHFIRNVILKKGDFPPVLDIEKLPKEQSIERLKIGLQRWLDIVERHYGVKPIIYSSESYYEDFLKDDFSDYPFWIANYSAFYKRIDSDWSIWQAAENANIEGIKGPVDVNIYNGNIEKLKELLI